MRTKQKMFVNTGVKKKKKCGDQDISREGIMNSSRRANKFALSLRGVINTFPPRERLGAGHSVLQIPMNGRTNKK